MTHDNLLLDLTQREVEVIRMALRHQEDTHKRNDFTHLVVEVQELRSKIADAIIDNAKELTKA
jgi:uncharacterized protein (DUF608 family)